MTNVTNDPVNSTLQPDGQRHGNRFEGVFTATRHQRKIRCPHCEVINLEKFVTYPHCAGCGALLTAEEPPRSQWAAWRRPLGPILWATIAGLAAVAVFSAALMLRRPPELGQLSLYGQVARRVPINGLLTLSLTLDAESSSSRETRTLKNPTFRISDNNLRDFNVLSITPKPASEIRSGSGHYFNFGSLPRGAQVQFVLRARRAGKHVLRVAAHADAHVPPPMNYVVAITVGPRKIELPAKTLSSEEKETVNAGTPGATLKN